MFNNFTLDKDEMNIVYIPVGNPPRSKVVEYLKDVHKNFDGYKVQLIAVPSEHKYEVILDNDGNITYKESI